MKIGERQKMSGGPFGLLITGGAILAALMWASTATATLKTAQSYPQGALAGAPARLTLAAFKSASPEAAEAGKSTGKIIAVCVLPGVKDRFVITSDAKLVRISEAGESTIIGVVTAPTSTEYLCMIRTEDTVVGVNGTGHLVNTESGKVIGALVPIGTAQK